ncbi:MAG: YigZ family protein [Nannocystaceae bacterium]|nr:YigZ family protein [Nannocystaceae bacterium]
MCHESDPTNGSRFIATAAPVEGESDARAVVAALRAEMPDATHHCAAWRIATPAIERAADDGEPSGSAGRPILAQLTGRGLVDVVVVVTRYFGGTKLGVGGLVRAYGGAAGAVLDLAVLKPRVAMITVEIEHTYPDGPGVEHALATLGVEPGDVLFGQSVVRTTKIAIAQRDGVEQALRDATSGRVTVRDAPSK